LLLSLVLGCRAGGRGGGGEAGPTGAAEGQGPPGGAPAPDEKPATNDIVLLFPGPEDDLLHAEKRSVLPIDSPEDRVKQCLEELVRGPTPHPGLLAAVPDGVQVREIYILPNGTAWADFSSELIKKGAGSTRELLTLYAIVDTVALNVRGISRFGILVEGRPRETLLGHVFTGQPIAPDFEYVEESARPPSPPPAPQAPAPAPAPSPAPGEAQPTPGEGQGTGGTKDGAAGADGRAGGDGAARAHGSDRADSHAGADATAGADGAAARPAPDGESSSDRGIRA